MKESKTLLDSEFYAVVEFLVFVKSVYLLLAFDFNLSRSGVLRVYFMWRHLEH